MKLWCLLKRLILITLGFTVDWFNMIFEIICLWERNEQCFEILCNAHKIKPIAMKCKTFKQFTEHWNYSELITSIQTARILKKKREDLLGLPSLSFCSRHIFLGKHKLIYHAEQRIRFCQRFGFDKLSHSTPEREWLNMLTNLTGALQKDVGRSWFELPRTYFKIIVFIVMNANCQLQL